MVGVLKDMAITKRHVKAIIQVRRATEAEWIEHDPILRLGEPALSTDVYKVKMGDGKSRWSKLDYLGEREYNIIMEYIDEHAGVKTASLNGIPQEIDGNKNLNIVLDLIDCGTSTTVI